MSTNGKGSNVSACWQAYKKGAGFANPCFTQIHPTCIPVHGAYQSTLTLMSESLRNDGRVWVPKDPKEKRRAQEIPDSERDYYLERMYPSYGNLAPRDISSRAAKRVCDEGRGVGSTKLAVYLDFADAIKRLGKNVIEERYGNLFQMYDKIVDEDPYQVPMMIYPAVHYAMGGLWVDYNLMSTIPGCFVLGEANFSDHGANRLGASALMQGLADGYFVIPYTIGGYLVGTKLEAVNTSQQQFKDAEGVAKDRINKLMRIKGKKTAEAFHRELGHIMWEYVGMGRTDERLKKAKELIPALRAEYWENVKILGSADGFNPSLVQAIRVADFMEFAELLVVDALNRRESCGGHFNEAFQTEEGEALRDDQNMAHAAVWEYAGEGKEPIFNKEPLIFENIKLAVRSYK